MLEESRKRALEEEQRSKIKFLNFLMVLDLRYRRKHGNRRLNQKLNSKNKKGKKVKIGTQNPKRKGAEPIGFDS